MSDISVQSSFAKNVWFTSDTHWGHKNIIKYSNRPFASLEEHDELLIANWNNVVRPKDDVFFLGDFSYKNKDAAANIRKRLMGNIFFIEGNHDAAAFQIRHMFGWYKQLDKIVVAGQDIVLCHYSMEVWNKSHHGAWHLFGHSHNSLPERSTSCSFDVGVDAVAMRLINKKQGDPISGTLQQDYRPINFEEVKHIMSKKQWKPIDHHGDRQ